MTKSEDGEDDGGEQQKRGGNGTKRAVTGVVASVGAVLSVDG